MTYAIVLLTVVVIVVALKCMKIGRTSKAMANSDEYIDEITESDFRSIRNALEQKSTSLMYQENKSWGIVGSDISKYSKVTVDQRVFFVVYASRVFQEILRDVLIEATQKYPSNFGKDSTSLVLEAIYKIEPDGNPKEFSDYI